MSYGGEGVARMRVLQVVVLIVFGVIAARLAYIQLIDSKYEELARGNALRYEVQYPSVARCSTATANIWYRVASVMT